MVITRSRRSPRIQKLKDEAEKAAQKSEKDQVQEPTEEVKVKRRKAVKPRGKKTKNPATSSNRNAEKSMSPKVESPSVSDNESKKQKIPAYKVQQLERLQRLIDMSSVAKPRGPVTYEDYSRRRKERNENQLRLILDKNNKYKISNVTNYDPVRQQFINGELKKEEIDELSEKYEKIQKYKNIKVPKLEDDIYLRKVLGEIVEKNQSSRFWEYYTLRTQNEPIGDAILLENEQKLNSIIKFEERKNSDDSKMLLLEPLVDNNYDKIDLNSVDKAFDLSRMVLSKEIMEMKEVEEADDSIFDGLKEEDYKDIEK